MQPDQFDPDFGTLIDIDNAARLAISFAEGHSTLTFATDLKTQSAVIHQIMVAGEATKRLSLEFRAAHPEVPWNEIAGMRDRLIHGYDRVKLDIVWSVLTHNLPNLRAVLAPILPK